MGTSLIDIRVRHPAGRCKPRSVALSRGAPGALLILPASCAAAVWSARAGPFPGTAFVERSPLPGSLVVAVAWLLCYAVLLLAFMPVTRNEERRGVIRRVTAVHAIVALAGVVAALAPESWLLLREPAYKNLYLLGVSAASTRLLLGRQTARLWRAANAAAAGTPAAAAVAAALVAAIMVGAVDLLLHVDGRWSAQFQLSHAGFAAGVLLLGALYLVGFAATARLWASIIAGSVLYLVLGLSTVAKSAYMHAGIQPLDLLYVAEFLPQIVATFGVGGVAACAAGALTVAIAIRAVWKYRAHRLTPCWRAAIAGSSLALLAMPAFAQSHDGMRRALEAAGIEIMPHDSLRSARRNGVLLEFLSLLPDALLREPEGYSPAAVERAVMQHGLASARAGAGMHDEQPTLIVYMIESLMYPEDLGLDLTADPIPTIRALGNEHASGHAIVPARFGESASSEFEVLTGMSMHFLPPRSVAYKQYIKRRVTSLPCMLESRGYRTVAVQADPVTFYNRREVYEHLCFERTHWLRENQDVARAVVTKYPADTAVVDAVIAEVEAGGPAFVFAFPSSTHHPYTRKHFASSELDLADPAASAARSELKYYLNALRVADAAVKELVDRLARMDRNVVLAIVGDHLPPLSVEALAGFYRRLEGSSGLEVLLAERRVPLVVWTSFPRDREHLSISLNMLGAHLLQAAGIETDGFARFIGSLHREMAVLSPRVVGAGGRYWRTDDVPDEYRGWIEDYRLLQHDMLFGDAYLDTVLETMRSEGIKEHAAAPSSVSR